MVKKQDEFALKVKYLLLDIRDIEQWSFPDQDR